MDSIRRKWLHIPSGEMFVSQDEDHMPTAKELPEEVTENLWRILLRISSNKQLTAAIDTLIESQMLSNTVKL